MESLTELIYRVQKNDKGKVVGRLNRKAAAAINAIFYFGKDGVGCESSTAQQLMVTRQRQGHAYVTSFEIFLMYERTRIFAIVASCCLHFDRAFDVAFRALRALRAPLTLGLTPFPRCVCVCVCTRARVLRVQAFGSAFDRTGPPTSVLSQFKGTVVSLNPIRCVVCVCVCVCVRARACVRASERDPRCQSDTLPHIHLIPFDRVCCRL